MTTTCGACRRQQAFNKEDVNARHAEGCPHGCPPNIPVLLPESVKATLCVGAEIPTLISTRGRCGHCIEQLVRPKEISYGATLRKHDPTCVPISSTSHIDERYGKHVGACNGCMIDMMLAYMTMRQHNGPASEHVIGCPNASRYISNELKKRVGGGDYTSCNLCRWLMFSGNPKRECWVPEYRPPEHCDTCTLPGHIQNMDPRFWYKQ
jgi:hypothetical protein